MIMTIGLSTMM